MIHRLNTSNLEFDRPLKAKGYSSKDFSDVLVSPHTHVINMLLLYDAVNKDGHPFSGLIQHAHLKVKPP